MAALYLEFIKPRLKTKYSFVSRNFLCTSKLASTSLAVVCKVREFVCLRTVQFHKIYFKSQSQYLVTHNTFQNNIKIHHTCISTYKKAWFFFWGGGCNFFDYSFLHLTFIKLFRYFSELYIIYHFAKSSLMTCTWKHFVIFIVVITSWLSSVILLL